MADGNVLAAIVERKRRDVAARFEGLSLDDLRSRATGSSRSLRQALQQPGARFICEVKRMSPSEGQLRDGVDVGAVALSYRGAADAISVLTDEPFFGGSLADLARVRSVFDGPILAKDFFVDVRQVAEAWTHGADAILVMLSVLGDGDARAMMAEAQRLGMDALVEVHDEDEMRRAAALGATIVGINNRDLRTLAVNLAVTERLADLAPPAALLVAESGIGDRADVERLAPHVDAFLVGTALMKADDPGEAARSLAFGRVKVCGLTDLEDVEAALEAGATYLGLIFVPGSPRVLSLEAAEALVGGVSRRARFVGVFANGNVLEVGSTTRALDLHAAQLHGREPESFVVRLRGVIGSAHEIWAACSVGEFAPPQRRGSDRTVFDTQLGSRAGGTGQSFDWDLIRHRPDLPSGVLAGGLHPGNARSASRVGAFALDVGSRIERAPGRKDHAAMRALFDALRPASRKEIAEC